MNILLYIIRVILALGIGWASLYPILGMLLLTLSTRSWRPGMTLEALGAIFFIIGGLYTWLLGLAVLILWPIRSPNVMSLARRAWIVGTLTLIGVALEGFLQGMPWLYVQAAVGFWLFSWPMWLFLMALGKPWKLLQRH